jgi:hypothetical protein
MTSRETQVPEFNKMAKTIETHIDDILSFWKSGNLSNAHYKFSTYMNAKKC